AVGQVLDDRMELGRIAFVYLDRMVHRQHHLVGVPIAEQVHAGGHQEGDYHAAAAADQPADRHEQRRQEGEQHRRADHIHFLKSWVQAPQARFSAALGYMMVTDTRGFNAICPAVTDENSPNNTPETSTAINAKRPLPEAARRALAEAEQRRAE